MLILNFWEWWMIEYLKKGMTSWNTRHCHFEIRLMLPCGGTWSGIWQFGGKLLIDDTDMGSNGERRNHQFTSTNPLGKLNAEIMEREYFSCLNPLQGSKYSPSPYRCFLWKQRLRQIYEQTHFTSSSLSEQAQPHLIFVKQNPNMKEFISWQDGRNSNLRWLACKTCGGQSSCMNKWEFLHLILKSILGLGRGNWCSPR